MFENLRTYLNTDFEKTLLEEAINNLKSNSRIRFSNFSYVMRELLDNILIRLADDKVVKQTPWYFAEQQDRKVTRRQRLKYIIQGNYNDFYFTSLLNINIDNEIGNLNHFMSKILSKHTHITENALNYTDADIEQMLAESETSIDNFINIINTLKATISTNLTDFIAEYIDNTFLNETFDDLDILSTHTEVENWYVEDINSININNNVISGAISGTVFVNLLYGSDRERRMGDGAEMKNSYPFQTTFSFEIPTADDVFDELGITEEDINDVENEVREYFISEILNRININEPIIDTNSFYE